MSLDGCIPSDAPKTLNVPILDNNETHLDDEPMKTDKFVIVPYIYNIPCKLGFNK